MNHNLKCMARILVLMTVAGWSMAQTENPVIGIAKSAGVSMNQPGGIVQTSWTMVLENLGNVDLTNVQVTDDLAVTFPLPVTFAVVSLSSPDLTVNPAYDGAADVNLLTGADSLLTGSIATLNLTVSFTPNGVLGPLFNQAGASGVSPSQAVTTDLSDDGSDPDPNGNGNPDEAGENDPTAINFQILTVPTLHPLVLTGLVVLLAGLAIWANRRRRTPVDQ